MTSFVEEGDDDDNMLLDLREYLNIMNRKYIPSEQGKVFKHIFVDLNKFPENFTKKHYAKKCMIK